MLDKKINDIETRQIFIYAINNRPDEVIDILKKNFKSLETVYDEIKLSSSVLTSDICKNVLTYYDYANSICNILKSNSNEIDLTNAVAMDIKEYCIKSLKLFYDIQKKQNVNIKNQGGIFRVKLKERTLYRNGVRPKGWENIVRLRMV